MPGDSLDFLRDLTRGKNGINKTSANRVFWHGVELCAERVLREGETAGRLYGANARRAIRSGSRKHDANCAGSTRFSQRFKKMVDGQVALLGATDQCQGAIFANQTFVRRLHIDGVGLWQHGTRNFNHRHLGRPAEQAGQPAGVMGIQMLDDDEGCSIFCRQML